MPSRPRVRRAAALVSGSALAVSLVAGCGGARIASGAPPVTGAPSVSVLITDAGCLPDPSTVVAGPVKAAQMNDHIWVGSGSDQAWMTGGSYLVSRRIRMHIEGWDRDVLSDQQEIFGRTKHEGAPMTGTRESDVPDYGAKRPDGTPVIAANSHIRLVAPENNGGRSILRRGYSYTDGIDPASGEFDAGPFFIAFMRDPQVFIDLQNKLGSQDALNEYIKHVASGLFACPGGVTTAGDHWGTALFA